MTGRSNALRLPVHAPRGVVYLTGLQWSLWWLLTRPRRSWAHGDLTLERLSRLTGSSRGRCWHAMTRLRSLELVSWRAYPTMPYERDRRPRRFSPGCRGRLLVWTSEASRRARRGAVGASRPRAIDSVSGPFGAYVSAAGAREGWRRRQQRRSGSWHSPPSDRMPRRGPPRVIYGRCPMKHTVRLGRRSWSDGPEWAPAVSARFVGWCSRCHAEVMESFELELAPYQGRGPSLEERRDPALDARRRALAAELLAAPAPAGPRAGWLLERLRRDYLERAPEAPPWAPESGLERLERLLPGPTIGAAGWDRGGEGSNGPPGDDPTEDR